ncbi:MAG: CocE/NonD family hydrolase [Bacteroidota bacterium]
MKSIICTLVGLLMTSGVFAQIIRENVVFKSGEHVLQGRVILPSSDTDSIPMLVFTGGENAFESFRTDYRDFLQRNVEDVLLPQGYGMFYIDTRGIDYSEGKWQRASYEDRAEDIAEGLAYLRTRREIDPNRIAVFGHGEGAYIAQIVASKNPTWVKSVIAFAGSTLDTRQQRISEYFIQYQCEGMDSTRSHRKARRKANSHQDWVKTFPVIKKWRQMRVIQDFNPDIYLQELIQPTLFLLPDNSRHLHPEWVIDKVEELYNGNVPDRLMLNVIPGTNHNFQPVPSCFDGDLSAIGYSEQFQTQFRNWVIQHL